MNDPHNSPLCLTGREQVLKSGSRSTRLAAVLIFLFMLSLLPLSPVLASGKDKDKCRDAIKVSCGKKDHKHGHQDRCEEYEPICSEQKWVKLEYSCQNGKGGWWSHNGKGRFENNTYHATDEEINGEAEIEVTYTSYDRNGGKKYNKCDKYQQKYRIKCRRSHDRCKHEDRCKWFKITADIDNVWCYGASTGHIDLHTTGGAAPYSFKWSSGETTPDLHNKPAGYYTVIATDRKGCYIKKTFKIEQSAPIQITKTIVPIIITENPFSVVQQGSITAHVTGGKPPYSYQFVNTLPITEPLPPGAVTVVGNVLTSAYDRIWKVIVTDSKGCTAEYTFPRLPVIRRTTPNGTPTAARLDMSETPAYSLNKKPLNVYPNVMREEATIEFTLEKASPYTLELYDQAGRLVKQISVGQAKAGETRQFRLDGSKLQPGTYYGKLFTPGASRTLRISKQ